MADLAAHVDLPPGMRPFVGVLLSHGGSLDLSKNGVRNRSLTPEKQGYSKIFLGTHTSKKT
jgi:hypothetical protein